MKTPTVLTRLAFACLLTAMSFACARAAGPPSAALDSYWAGDLEGARAQLEAAAAVQPDDADLRAWLAETCRRLGDARSATRHARAALMLEPCHAFAHTVIADAANPQFESEAWAHADTTWVHNLAAVACDSTYGQAWQGIWCEALRRGDEAREHAALRQLYRGGFETPCALEYARWLLGSMPQNALLIVNGDQDTYPPLSLQQEEQLRTDVVVLNRSLLNLAWYAQLMSRRHGLELPESIRGSSPMSYSNSDTLVRLWLESAQGGPPTRPIALSVTMDGIEKLLEPGYARVLKGPWYAPVPGDPIDGTDEEAILASLKLVDMQAFAGPFASPADTSPIRVNAGKLLIHNVPTTAVWAARELVRTDRRLEAGLVLDWIDAFGGVSSSGPLENEGLTSLRAELAAEEAD